MTSFFLVIIWLDIIVGTGILSLLLLLMGFIVVGVVDFIVVFGFVICFLWVGLNWVAVVQLAFTFIKIIYL